MTNQFKAMLLLENFILQKEYIILFIFLIFAIFLTVLIIGNYIRCVPAKTSTSSSGTKTNFDPISNSDVFEDTLDSKTKPVPIPKSFRDGNNFMLAHVLKDGITVTIPLVRVKAVNKIKYYNIYEIPIIEDIYYDRQQCLKDLLKHFQNLRLHSISHLASL
jgi:hypothetical protein